MIYVMSDIHGNLERFESIMSQIELKEDDSLYILGDVIDRYPDGIKILQKIMNATNIKMLLGNHEKMMLDALYYPIANSEKQNPELDRRLELWYQNGGEVTHAVLKDVDKEEQEKIFNYLGKLPINIDIEVNDKKYLLVHAGALENFKLGMRQYKTPEAFALWTKDVYRVKGKILVYGHIPPIGYKNKTLVKILRNGPTLGIDCGAGYPFGRLACLRLDDMEAFYSE